MIEDMRKQALNPAQTAGPWRREDHSRRRHADSNLRRRANAAAHAAPVVLPNEIPDYLPAVERVIGSFRADADNRVWIRPKPPSGAPRGGGTIYDVVDRTGALIDRVQLPVGRTLVGFGPGGVVFVTVRDGSAVKLEKHSFK